MQVEPQIENRKFVLIGIAAVIALGSIILYAKIDGTHRIPSAPNTGIAGYGSLPPRHPVVAGRSQSSGSAAPQRSGQSASLPTVEGMIERLSERLKANPDDADGWRTLAWSYASQGRLNDAATAYEEAIKRQPDNADLYGARGEVLVHAGSGVVSPEAAALFEEALKRDKDNPRARFFLGLKKEQAGNRIGALDDWIGILQGAPPDAPWARDLREHVEQLAADLKVNAAGRLPPVLPAVPPPVQIGAARGAGLSGSPPESGPAAAGASTAAREPAAGNVQRGPADSPEDKMIRSMVDGLASRLDKQPRDLAGWSRLIRSRKVLGETDKAKAALIKARETFADAPEALAEISAVARELGLEP